MPTTTTIPLNTINYDLLHSESIHTQKNQVHRSLHLPARDGVAGVRLSGCDAKIKVRHYRQSAPSSPITHQPAGGKLPLQFTHKKTNSGNLTPATLPPKTNRRKLAGGEFHDSHITTANSPASKSIVLTDWPKCPKSRFGKRAEESLRRFLLVEPSRTKNHLGKRAEEKLY